MHSKYDSLLLRRSLHQCPVVEWLSYKWNVWSPPVGLGNLSCCYSLKIPPFRLCCLPRLKRLRPFSLCWRVFGGMFPEERGMFFSFVFWCVSFFLFFLFILASKLDGVASSQGQCNSSWLIDPSRGREVFNGCGYFVSLFLCFRKKEQESQTERQTYTYG